MPLICIYFNPCKKTLKFKCRWSVYILITTHNYSLYCFILPARKIIKRKHNTSGWKSLYSYAVLLDIGLFPPKSKSLHRPCHGSAGLSPRNPGSVHVGFVVDKVALGQVFPRVLRVSPVNFIPPVLHYKEKIKKKTIIFFTGLHNKPRGCGASVASAAGPFTPPPPKRISIFMRFSRTVPCYRYSTIRSGPTPYKVLF
jgi:hypothetical protein